MPLPIWSQLGGEGAIGAGGGGVWVVIDGSGCKNCLLARVDPEDDESRRQDLGVREVVVCACGLRRGVGGLARSSGTVQKVSPTSNKVVVTTTIGRRPRFFDVGEGGVWTLNQADETVSRIAPTGKLVATISANLAGGGGDMAVGGGSVWPRAASTLLTRIDPKTNKVVQVYGPPSGSGSVAVGPGGVWISAHDVDGVASTAA